MKKKHGIFKLVFAICSVAIICAAAYYLVRKLRERDARPLEEISAAIKKVTAKINALKPAADGAADEPEVDLAEEFREWN